MCKVTAAHFKVLRPLSLLLILIGSWWLPKPYNLHLFIDEITAGNLQWLLRLSRTWQLICAFLNADLFDGAMYSAIIAFTVFAFWQVPSHKKRSAIRRFLLYYTLLSIGQYGFKYLLHTTLHFHRLSPTLSLADIARIDPGAIGIYFKDSSRRSFPGDHALFLFGWAMFWMRGYSRALCGWALAIASFFSLPRLLIGGHWFSDLTLGGILPAWIFAKIALGSAEENFGAVRLKRETAD